MGRATRPLAELPKRQIEQTFSFFRKARLIWGILLLAGIALVFLYPDFIVLISASIIIPFALWALWKVPKGQVLSLKPGSSVRIHTENEARKTLAQILGGGILISSLYLTYNRDLEVRKNAQEARNTEQFTVAIQQLSSDKSEIRLAALYGLERIARYSERDHSPIMEVLAAYVRENAPWPHKNDQLGPLPERTSIQATLSILGRRTVKYEREDTHLDLRRTDLRGVNLVQANLQQARLVGANLQGASLDGANLQGASLNGANLQGASLNGAHLEGVDLRRTLGLTQAQTSQSCMDKRTQLPEEVLTRPSLCP